MRIFKPHRGTTYAMTQTEKKDIILAKGEFFVEVPNTGVGTGPSIVKIGDGIHRYEELPVALSGTEECNVDDSSSTTTIQALNKVISGSKSSVLFGELKKAILLNMTAINQINEDKPFRFEYHPDNPVSDRYGYLRSEDNTFVPFRSQADIDRAAAAAREAAMKGNAKVEEVLEGKTFTNETAVELIGTMPNKGKQTASLNCGNSYIIPKGYHDGTGTVTANSLSSQTNATATAAQILKNYTAWVNGSKITGTIADYSGSGNVIRGIFGSGNSSCPAIRIASLTPKTQIGGGNAATAEYLEIAMPTGKWGWSWGNSSCCIPTQTKSASPSTSAQTISADGWSNGSVPYALKSVSISAISPQRTAGTSATLTGIDNSGPYVYFPYGWWPNSNSTYGCYTRLSAAQAVNACPKETKSVTSSVTQTQTVTPSSGKLLSSVTVNALTYTDTFLATTRSEKIDMGTSKLYRYVNTSGVPNTNSATYTATERKSNINMGATNNYMYVDTTGVPNTNSTTYTCPKNWDGSSPKANGNGDMGATNTYRYVNASNVYNKGYSDGNTNGKNEGYADGYAAASYSVSRLKVGTSKDGCSGTVGGAGTLLVFGAAYVDDNKQIPTITVKIGSSSKTATVDVKNVAGQSVKVWQLSVSNNNTYSVKFSSGGSNTLRYEVYYVVWLVKKS